MDGRILGTADTALATLLTLAVYFQLAARRQIHMQRRQEGIKEIVRCVDAAKDRGFNAHAVPPPMVLIIPSDITFHLPMRANGTY